MGHVKRLRWVWAVALIGAVLPLKAQTTDWQTVKGIAPGTSISVAVLNHRGKRACDLLTVTDSELTCNLERGRLSKMVVLRRDDIREIRMEYHERHHMLAGALIGGASGLAIGFLASRGSSDPETRAVTPVFGAIVGSALGAGVGRAIHEHGPILYRRQ